VGASPREDAKRHIAASRLLIKSTQREVRETAGLIAGSRRIMYESRELLKRLNKSAKGRRL
jgi:hypothetical protein